MARTGKPRPASDEKTGGMRMRKKARRREDILRHAAELFSAQGVDATTMAEIADAVEVSPPTIFNYFGNKDGILIALVTEGTSRGRVSKWAEMPVTNGDFRAILLDLFANFSADTLEIAGKRIWRYAEAATIRHPTTELARSYETLDAELRRWLAGFFDLYDVRLRSGERPDPALLARIFHDVWNAAFFELIKDESMTLARHRDTIEARLEPLASMLFTDAFLTEPTLKSPEVSVADR